MAFIFSFPSEVKPRCCLVGQQRSIPAHDHAFIFTDTKQRALATRPKNSHTPAQRSPVIRSICRTPSCHMLTSLCQGKEMQKKSLQNTHVAAGKLRKMRTEHRGHIHTPSEGSIHGTIIHPKKTPNFHQWSSASPTRACPPALIYLIGFLYVPGCSLALLKDSFLFFDASDVRRDTKAGKCSSDWDFPRCLYRVLAGL